MPADNPYQSPQAKLSNEPSVKPAGGVFLRLVGAVLASFGILLAWLAFKGASRLLQGPLPVPDLSVVSASGILLLIMSFCLYAGVRLLFLLPTARGSLLTPLGWYALAVFVGGLCGLLAIANLVGTGAGSSSVNALLALVFGGVFSAACIRAARGRSASYGYPSPDADIAIDNADAAPAWVEIHNDDRTPMEFVVATLCAVFSLQREQAIALMLRVHRGGNARVPCASLDEARQRAAAIIERARAAGHPLHCQAADTPSGSADAVH